MATKTIDIRDAKEQLADLLLLVEAGTEVILTEDDKPRARIVSVGGVPARVAGLHRDAIWTSDDFDEPLSDDFWTSGE